MARAISSSQLSPWAPEMSRSALDTRPRAVEPGHVSRTEVFASCVALIVLELNHLKWIWWEYWSCRKCGEKNRDCGCSSKWVMYL